LVHNFAKRHYAEIYLYGILTSVEQSVHDAVIFGSNIVGIRSRYQFRPSPNSNHLKEEIQLSTKFSSVAGWLKRFAIAASILGLGACASQQYPSVPAGDVATPGHEYLIGPGDTVSIAVWRNPEVSQSVPVRPDGKITTPLVQDLNASGKTATQLARDIEKALEKFIQQPIVTVIVTGFVGPYSEQIRVVGQAAKPQALPYREQMSLMDVLIAVGGITEFAAGNKAVLIRTVDGKQQKYSVRLNDLIKEGDLSANVGMRPGDVVVIPESFF
jgi:polysaccharide export outer membrane protein